MQCNYLYCGTCFDEYHKKRGPLANHAIVKPYEEAAKILPEYCETHVNEILKVFCLQCGICICFLCKEIGMHRDHKVEIIASLAEKVKVNMTTRR